MYEHPSFHRAKALPEPLRSHFPKTSEEATIWKPWVLHRALAARVLAVARTRVECTWAAYVDAVPGHDHDEEVNPVLDRGIKLDEAIARELFPVFEKIPYAR